MRRVSEARSSVRNEARIVKASSVRSSSHAIVACAVRSADENRDLGTGSRGDRADEFGAVLGDALER